VEIQLIIQLLALVQANAPWVLEAIREGRGAEINWKGLRGASQQALEEQVDAKRETIA